MHSGAMSPAQQYQTSPHSLFFPSPPGASLSLPHSSHSHSASNQNSSYNSFNSNAKAGFPSNHFLSDGPVVPIRPDAVSGVSAGSAGRHATWPTSPYSSHLENHSSPGLDSTGGDTNSSPTSPQSPHPGWQGGYPSFTNFAPPNTVAPGPSGQTHRPDAVLGGGAHRYSALSARGCNENSAPPRGFELVQVLMTRIGCKKPWNASL